jgi:hypothetical protein
MQSTKQKSLMEQSYMPVSNLTLLRDFGIQVDQKNLSTQFGAGSRTCIGKNIALLEISKLLPELIRRFDFLLSMPDKTIEMENVWIVKQKNVCCHISPRKP